MKMDGSNSVEHAKTPLRLCTARSPAPAAATTVHCAPAVCAAAGGLVLTTPCGVAEPIDVTVLVSAARELSLPGLAAAAGGALLVDSASSSLSSGASSSRPSTVTVTWAMSCIALALKQRMLSRHMIDNRYVVR